MVMEAANIVIVVAESLWGTIKIVSKNVIRNVAAMVKVINIWMVPTIVQVHHDERIFT
jgi:hypothetical protein